MFSNNSDLIQIRDKLNSTLFPVVILLCLYIVFGLFGNIMLIVYYSYKIKRNPSFIFIVAMAISDLVVCCTSIPLEIVDVIEFYTFPSGVACKLLRTISYFAVSTSGLFLLAIAVDRYRNICKPLQKQISTQQAKRIIIVIIVFVCFMAWPNLIFYDVKRINIDKDHGVMKSELNLTHAQSVIGYDCTTGIEDRLFVTIYHTILFLCFILTVFSLIILYYQVVKEVIRMKNLRRRMSVSGKQTFNKNDKQSSRKINHKNCENRESPFKEFTETKYTDTDNSVLDIHQECSNNSHDNNHFTDSNRISFTNSALDVYPECSNILQDTKKLKQCDDKDNKTIEKSQLNSKQIYVTILHVYYPSTCASLNTNFKGNKFHENVESYGLEANLDKPQDDFRNGEQTYCYEKDEPSEANCTLSKNTHNGESTLNFNPISNYDGPNRRQSQSNANRIHKKKFTFIALSITGAFIVSFLPYLSLMVWQTLSDDMTQLFGARLVVFEIFIRSWLLNSVVNPIIYGFFNCHFREFVISLLCRLCCCLSTKPRE